MEKSYTKLKHKSQMAKDMFMIHKRSGSIEKSTKKIPQRKERKKQNKTKQKRQVNLTGNQAVSQEECQMSTDRMSTFASTTS